VPLYFFHVRLGTMLVHDTEGEVFENLSAAKSGADDRSKRLLRSALRLGEIRADGEIEITDESGFTVAALQPAKQAEDIRALP
jgi:hypothetical protein